ncbi:hypothetical protein E2E30_14220 [Sphingomonas sp. AAP5]|nr:hypothetical protein E2E30_14220 [Sphingomonas sp. AAP5]
MGDAIAKLYRAARCAASSLCTARRPDADGLQSGMAASKRRNRTSDPVLRLGVVASDALVTGPRQRRDRVSMIRA